MTQDPAPLLSKTHTSIPSSTNSRRNFLIGSAASVVLTSAATTAAFFNTPAAAVAATTTGVVDLNKVGGPIQYGDAKELMSPKEHGTSHQPVQSNLLYGVSTKLADQICNFNRHFAEPSGYFTSTNLEDVVVHQSAEQGRPITFYDSVTGKPLFVLRRSAEEFLAESKQHGWPSFRDEEVVWDNVRVLRGIGETVSVDGTHLGHNLPDAKGNRYCINLVSIAGHAAATGAAV